MVDKFKKLSLDFDLNNRENAEVFGEIGVIQNKKSLKVFFSEISKAKMLEEWKIRENR